jgi:hypothetical protein
MPNSKKLETIYVDLDVLLDTRLGTIAILDQNIAEKLSVDENYQKRLSDDFEGIDLDLYKELYKNRDVTTLKHSVVTNAISLLRHLVSVMAEQAITRPYHDGLKIVVNTHPYILSGEEMEEFGKVISVWLDGLAPVELVSIPTKDLTPVHCKTYAIIIKYDYEEWMNMQGEAFKATQLPTVTLLVPAIYFVKTPTDAELKKTMKETTHPFKALEVLASPLISLTLIDVSHFSILKPN